MWIYDTRDARGGAFSSGAGRDEKARKSTDPKIRQKCVNCYGDICSVLWCVGVMKRGGICSQFCPAAPSGFRGTGRASLTSIVKWWNIRLFFLLLPNNSLKRPNGWIYRTAFDGSVLRSQGQRSGNNFFEIPPLLRKISELKTRPTLSSQCSCQTDQYLLRQPSKTNINQWENINTVAIRLDRYHQLWSIIPCQPRMFRSPAP